jgi:hypothetical protein
MYPLPVSGYLGVQKGILNTGSLSVVKRHLASYLVNPALELRRRRRKQSYISS